MVSSTAIVYTDNPDFNAWLDENFEVEVEEFSFPASEVLFKLNYDQYLEALERYNTDPQIFTQRIFKKFPSPIAYYLYQAENNFQNDHHRLDLLKSCWESIIYSIFGLVVSEARHRKLDLKSLGIKYSDYWSDRLAVKLDIVENILSCALTNGYPLETVNIIPLSATSNIRKLNQERNGFEHASAKTAAQQKHLYEELFPLVLKVLNEVMRLESVEFLRYFSAESMLLPRCESFNGNNLTGEKKYIIMKQQQLVAILDHWDNKSVYAKINDEVFCLSPFIHFYQEIYETNPLICFFKQDKGGKYWFEVTSKSTEHSFEKSDFDWIEKELRAITI